MTISATLAISYLQPHWNATYQKSSYTPVDMDDAPEVSAELCKIMVDHTIERLTDAGLGLLLSREGVTVEIEGMSYSHAETAEDLTFVVSFTLPEGTQIGVSGIMLDDGEVCLDHGMFVEE